ncbi:MAG TPA: GGDEF domain-containing protein [Haloplasmataceae bacterium]
MSEWVYDKLIVRSSLATVFLFVIYITLSMFFIMKHVGDRWVLPKRKFIAFFVMAILVALILFTEQEVDSSFPFSITSYIISSAIMLLNSIYLDVYTNFITFILVTAFRLLFVRGYPFGDIFLSHLKFILLFLGTWALFRYIHQSRRRFYYTIFFSMLILLIEFSIIVESPRILIGYTFIVSMMVYIITGVALKLITRYQIYYEQAHKDFLTDLYNDRALYQQMRLITRLGRDDFCYIFIDFNGLKKINDTYGHIYGDAALVLVANQLKAFFSKHSLLFRKSGDEFVVIVEEHVDKVKELSERFLNKLNERFVATKKGNFYPRLAIGIVHIQKHMNARDIFELADRAMYQAKSSQSPVIVKKVK